MFKTDMPALPAAPPSRLAYRPREVATLIGCSEAHVKREIYKGHLRARKSGTQTLIGADTLREYLSTETSNRKPPGDNPAGS